MASIITIAGEKLFAAKAQANEQLDIDTFIFANVPGQDATDPINREEGLPTDHVVHQQIVQQVGRINDNVVVYSTVLDSITGPFEFNWVGLYSSINDTLVAINHVPTTPKTATAAGVAGNTLNRNFGIEYSGIADLTGIDVAPETWQLDFTARLQGMDKLTQQLTKDMVGKDSFIDDGFKVIPRSTANTFEMIPGAGYVNGFRVERDTVWYINMTPDQYPLYVYADAYFEGDASSTWAPRVITYLSTDPDKQDFIDGSGVQHYMAPLAIIKGDNDVEDLRVSFTEKEDNRTHNFKTVAEMKSRNANFKVGKKVYWQGYYEESDGGSNWGIVKEGEHTEDGLEIFSLGNGKYVKANLKGSRINIKKGGAKGDGIEDDHSSIQNVITYACNNSKEIYFPSTENEYYRVTDTLIVDRYGTSIWEGPAFKWSGEGYTSRVVLDSLTHLEFFVKATSPLRKLRMDGVYFDANGNADICFSTNGNSSPYLTLSHSTFKNATKIQLELETYVSTLSSVICQGGERGFKIYGVGSGPATSITMSSCYALGNSIVGYDMGYLTYCTLNSCACDETSLAYSIQSAYGVTMNSCGAERSDKFLYVKSFRGLTINTVFMLSAGSSIPGEPTEYLIELQAGTGAVISGVNVGTTREGGFKYKLGVTSTSYGFNDVNILDDTIRRGEVYAVSTYGHTRSPVRGEFYDKITREQNNIVNNYAEVKTDTLNGIELTEEVTYSLADGLHDDIAVKYIFSVKGVKRLIFAGNSSDNTLVTLKAASNKLAEIRDCKATVVFKDLTITAGAGSSYGFLLEIINSNVVFDNVRFVASNNLGCAYSTDNSNIEMTNSIIVPSSYWKGYAGDGETFIRELGEYNKISYSSVSAAPTDGMWNKGVILDNESPEVGEYLQWVNTQSNGWRGIGLIESAF